MEVNNEPRLSVDEKQDGKTFEVKSDIDDSHEVQELTAARTPMKISRPLFMTCNQTLAFTNGFLKTY